MMPFAKIVLVAIIYSGKPKAGSPLEDSPIICRSRSGHARVRTVSYFAGLFWNGYAFQDEMPRVPYTKPHGSHNEEHPFRKGVKGLFEATTVRV